MSEGERLDAGRPDADLPEQDGPEQDGPGQEVPAPDASAEQPEAADIDWGSPRWRQPDVEKQADAERDRRFRDDASPAQRGALDRGDSIPNRGHDTPAGAPEGKGRRPRPARDEPAP